MKERKYNRSPFNEWRDSKSPEYGKYVWPQICYDWTSGKIIHVVYEKPKFGQPSEIQWPSNIISCYPTTYIDFTMENPIIFNPLTKTSNNWDYPSWATNVLGSSRANKVNNKPSSFWDYRSQSKPYGNKACDIDAVEKSKNGKWFGIEATRFNMKITSIDQAINYLFYEILQNRPGGFNGQQLLAQKEFMDKLKGDLYLVIHHESNDVLSENDNAYVCKLTIDCLMAIANRCRSNFNPAFHKYGTFIDIYNQLKESSEL